MTHLDFPLSFDRRGRSAETTDPLDYVRGLVELTLMTAPGERVNRPTFGAGLPEMVFEPGTDTLAEATEVLVRSSLQTWLADLVLVESLTVTLQDSTLLIDLAYQVLATGERVEQSVERTV